MGIALSENVRNSVAAALQSLGVEATLLLHISVHPLRSGIRMRTVTVNQGSLEDLPTTLEKVSACGF